MPRRLVASQFSPVALLKSQTMKKQLSLFFLVCFSLSMAGQITFNKRFHFDFPAAVLTSVISTDSCYYASGIIADSIFPYNTGAIFLKLDLDGQPVLIKTLRSTQKTYEPWFNDLQPQPDGSFVVSAVTVDSTMKSMLIKYNSLGDTLFLREYLNPFYPAQNFMQPRGGFTSTKDGGFVIEGV